MPDRRLLEIEDQINFLLKGPQPTPKTCSTHIPQAYAKVVSSNPLPRNLNEPPRQNSFTFHERVCLNPQPEALGTNFEARVRDYMAAHTERMERFENAIFKQREEINDRMTKMFGLLKELTASQTPGKMRKRNVKDHKVVSKNAMKFNVSDAAVPLKKSNKEKEAENRTKNEPVESVEKKLTQIKEEELMEAPNSQSVGYYLKHKINKKLVEGLIENQRFNESVSHPNRRFKTHGCPGIAEDVLVDVAGYVYPMDFVILDIKEDKQRPFILGTPFLTIYKAVIKFDKGMITLRSGKSKISFHKIPETRCRIKKGTKNEIDLIALTMTINRLVLEWAERIKLHQEKEMKLDQ
ncbi:MAK10-like protein [Tanacetum coccineum]